jgi:hypothetical protein
LPIDSGFRREYDPPIEWRTYTPDGRVLTVSRTGTEWCASCEGRDAEHVQLIEALRDAVGQERGEGLLLGAASTAAMERWIRETAAHIVGDTLH